MNIWIDADSCPAKVREIISKAAFNRQITAIFVANRKIPLTIHKWVSLKLVEKGEGKTDDFIFNNVSSFDLVITRDIPLADRLVTEGIIVLNDRGTIFTKENIKERLSIRNEMLEYQRLGLVNTPKKSSFGKKEVQAFANTFDRELHKAKIKYDRSNTI